MRTIPYHPPTFSDFRDFAEQQLSSYTTSGAVS